MHTDLQTQEVIVTEEAVQFKFVIDADLIHVGGGSAVLDY